MIDGGGAGGCRVGCVGGMFHFVYCYVVGQVHGGGGGLLWWWRWVIDCGGGIVVVVG